MGFQVSNDSKALACHSNARKHRKILNRLPTLSDRISVVKVASCELVLLATSGFCNNMLESGVNRNLKSGVSSSMLGVSSIRYTF